MNLYALTLKNIYPLILLICSFGIYFTHYGSPSAMFWDENYHIASAQKHIDGIMYMEPHPPLGKMLMGLAEAVIDPNANIDKQKFTQTDHIQGSDTPAGMKYTGYRWPSVVLMALSVLFFYGILRRITQNQLIAFLFSSFIIFDNALVNSQRQAEVCPPNYPLAGFTLASSFLGITRFRIPSLYFALIFSPFAFTGKEPLASSN